MSALCKDGTPLTLEIQNNASLLYFETPNGNIIIINDRLMNSQSIILTKEDFKRVKDLHAVGGKVVELEFSETLVSGEFADKASGFNIFPEFEKIEDVVETKHIGTVVFKGKDVSRSYTIINLLDDQVAVLDTRILQAEIIDPKTDNDLYRLKILIPEMSDRCDILKAISIDVGPITENIEYDLKEAEVNKA